VREASKVVVKVGKGSGGGAPESINGLIVTPNDRDAGGRQRWASVTVSDTVASAPVNHVLAARWVVSSEQLEEVHIRGAHVLPLVDEDVAKAPTPPPPQRPAASQEGDGERQQVSEIKRIVPRHPHFIRVADARNVCVSTSGGVEGIRDEQRQLFRSVATTAITAVDLTVAASDNGTADSAVVHKTAATVSPLIPTPTHCSTLPGHSISASTHQRALQCHG